MQEFKPLDDSQPIFGKLFIEASAGTGKTFAIEHVVRRLVEQGFSLREILITTFTRAGARDLKRRIHDNLQRPMDDAEIHTIHSFCHSMLTEYSFEAKTDPHMEEEENKGQVATAILDTFRTLDNTDDFLAAIQGHQRDLNKLTRRMATYLLSNPTITEDTPFHRIAKKAQEKLASRRIKNPDSLLETMIKSLKLPQFKHLVQKRFRAIIVDEFQDTDPRQWEIFYDLFHDTAETFLVVGDPKQSIYGFRGADLKTFFKAKKSFSNIYVLSTNYRSAPGLVTACNQLFGGVKGLFTFQEEEELAYHPVNAGRKEEGGEIVIAAFEGEKGRSSSWPTQAVEEEKLFPYIASQLEEKNTAILVKDRYQATRLSDFLSKYNIPHISNATSSLVETKSFRFLELAFELAAHPRNLNFLKQFLVHPFVGWPLDKAATDLTDPDLQKAVSDISRLGTLLKEDGKAAFLRELLSLYPPSTNEDYSDFMQMVQILIENEIEFEELKTLDPEEYSMLKRKPLGQKANVTIMTSHMSKGLEFDVVFALGIASRTPENDVDPLATDQEKMRLLYVSCTRAREKLYLLFPMNRDKKLPPLGTASPLELLFARSNKPFLSHEQTYSSLSSIHFPLTDIQPPIIRERERERLRARFSPPSLPPPKQYLSFSSLSTPHTFHTFSTPDPLPQGSHTGNLFHLLFEKIIETGLYFPWNHTNLQTFIQQELSGTHLESCLPEVYSTIKTAFHTPLLDFCLKEIPPANMLQETQFLYPIEERKYMKGFADLIFSVGNTYYILDWKLNRLPAYEKEDLERAMQDNEYYSQAAIYAEALRRYLTHIPNATFGGTFYFFLRAKEKGVLHFVPLDAKAQGVRLSAPLPASQHY